MNTFSLNVDSRIKGGYLSSELIDLISIVRCSAREELIDFISHCDQLIRSSFLEINNPDLEVVKRNVFAAYQETMIPHNSGRNASLANRMEYLDIDAEIAKAVFAEKEEDKKVLDRTRIDLNHHFVSEEWDQVKTVSYDEVVELSNMFNSEFNSITIGSARIYKCVNRLDKRIWDPYFLKRDLDFAVKNGKSVRLHALLVQGTGGLFPEDIDNFKDREAGKKKILNLISFHVSKMIEFLKQNKDYKPYINAIDVFNEIFNINRDRTIGYYNIWMDRYGITLEDIVDCFKPIIDNDDILDGIPLIYNEPRLEDEEKRKAVIDILEELNEISIEKYGKKMIDTLGTQMHISIPLRLAGDGLSDEQFKNTSDYKAMVKCFEDFRVLQEKGYKIQITEFDVSVKQEEIGSIIGDEPTYTSEDVYRAKERWIRMISDIIRESGVRLDGISYWSLTDSLDFNLERIRDRLIAAQLIYDPDGIETVYGGYIPTYGEGYKLAAADGNELDMGL